MSPMLFSAGAAAPLAYNGLYHAGAYAGYAPYAAHFGGLVAHPNGAVVPVDEPAVQAAKAEHFAAKGVPAVAVAAPVAAPYAAGFGYHGLVAHPNGAIVPAEPADVVAARADHLAAHGAPVVAPAAPVAPYYAPGFAGLVAHPNGALVPAEPA